VAIFQLKQICTPADDSPVHWTFDRTEVIADGVVHILGVSLGLIGSIALFLKTPGYAGVDVVVYAASLVTMLGLSATYNLWPVSPRKWLLRRFDHSAIYLLIAATYTPFISKVGDRAFAINFLLGVWGVAIAGTVLKLNFPGRFDKLSIVLYLALGWSGVLAYEKAATALPSSVLFLIALGGAVYTIGVLFHSWERLRFQNAIWHSFVMLGAACHYTAVAGLIST
jgi:hemolysin III